PRAVCGAFDPRFLEIPAEVIVSAMRAHQRYFATETADGSLANKFVTIAGTVTKDPAVVQHGNETVLAARLSDARFFHDADGAVPLADHAKKLGGVVFQAKLGTVGEKTARLATWSAFFASQVTPAKLERAALLAKADLVSKMVGEFPDLQGVMGRHYAKLGG